MPEFVVVTDNQTVALGPLSHDDALILYDLVGEAQSLVLPLVPTSLDDVAKAMVLTLATPHDDEIDEDA
jgi:hypothetical protein